MASGMNPRATAMGKMKKPKKELDHIRVKAAKNGGQETYLHHTSEYEHPPEGPHIFPAHGEKVPVVEGHLFHHLAKHLGIPHEVMGGKEEAKEHEPDEMEEEEMEA